ncbi:MAG: CRISPR-associated endonuclease Cas3'' [Ilumatobacteraceae bacterium]
MGDRSRSTGAAIGLPNDLAEVVAFAGRFHDVGKADRRFQRWLDPDGGGRPHCEVLVVPRQVAGESRAAGWLQGGRHEALSGRLVQEWLRTSQEGARLGPVQAALLLHLVVSHHGHARPMIAPAADTAGGDVALTLDGTDRAAAACLSDVDWEQPRRFRLLNDEFGPWGLALLEAIVRRSDHAVSGGGWTGRAIE